MHNHDPRPIPDDWSPSEDDKRYAKSLGMTAEQFNEDARRFKAHYRKQTIRKNGLVTNLPWLAQANDGLRRPASRLGR
jgi:hypothetical protein